MSSKWKTDVQAGLFIMRVVMCPHGQKGPGHLLCDTPDWLQAFEGLGLWPTTTVFCHLCVMESRCSHTVHCCNHTFKKKKKYWYSFSLTVFLRLVGDLEHRPADLGVVHPRLVVSQSQHTDKYPLALMWTLFDQLKSSMNIIFMFLEYGKSTGSSKKFDPTWKILNWNTVMPR